MGAGWAQYVFVPVLFRWRGVRTTGAGRQACVAVPAVACFMGVVVLIGAFIGPTIRAWTPRAAMLGTLAGISIAFISMAAAFQMYTAAWIAQATFAIILLSWTAGVRLPFGIPGGLAAIVVGTALGWASYAIFGWHGLDPQQVSDSFKQFGIHIPGFETEALAHLTNAATPHAQALRLGVDHFTDARNNVRGREPAAPRSTLEPVQLDEGGGERSGGKWAQSKAERVCGVEI